MSTEARRPEIVVDLAAIRRNVTLLRDLVAPDGADVMVVVKADGYGHGMVESARAARAAGAAWLGVATIEEAVRLREAGDTGRLLCWLTVPGDDWGPRSSATRTSRRTPWPSSTRSAPPSGGTPARVQLKIDTGLSRGGSTSDAWPDVLSAARPVRPTGSGPSPASGRTWPAPTSPSTPPSPSRSRRSGTPWPAPSGRAAPRGATPRQLRGCDPPPVSRFDLVRCGIAAYGLDPAPGASPDLGLEPAMTVTAPLALTKHVHAGSGVSYGHTWTTPTETRVGLVPLGYGDGIPRHAGNAAEVEVAGKRVAIRGRICMDQFVVELGDTDEAGAEPGDEVVLFGPGTTGRADRRRLGAGVRHHPLRDRDPHRRAPAPPLHGGHHRTHPTRPLGNPTVSKTSKVLSVAAGAAGVAAAGTALRVARQRAIINRRGAGDHAPFGSLRSKPISVVTDDGVDLHVEVDEYDGGKRRSRRAPELTVVFVHGYSLNLDSWHFQRAAYRGQVRTVFYDQRSHGRSGRSTPGHATIEQLGHDLKAVIDSVVPEGPIVLVGHSMGGMTIMALAEEHPELFHDRIVGVALISTTAGGLEPHRILIPVLPGGLAGIVAQRMVAVLARGHRTIDGVRRLGRVVATVVTDGLAFGDDRGWPHPANLNAAINDIRKGRTADSAAPSRATTR